MNKKVMSIMFDSDYADPDFCLTEEMGAVWADDEKYFGKLPRAVQAEICKRLAEIFSAREQTIRAIMAIRSSNT